MKICVYGYLGNSWISASHSCPALRGSLVVGGKSGQIDAERVYSVADVAEQSQHSSRTCYVALGVYKTVNGAELIGE